MDSARLVAVGLMSRSQPRHDEFPRDPFVSQYASAPLEPKESGNQARSASAAGLRVRWVARALHLITCGYRRGFPN
jgi:hypothetical protein